MTDLDPEIAAFADALSSDWASHPPLSGLSMTEGRAVAEKVRARWTAGGPVMAERRDLTIDTEDGPIGIRLHRPHGAPAQGAPALLYVHGGGFVTFSLDTHDRLMREYAGAGGFVVIGVDYPLSPEARYPVALDRIVALVRWLAERGAELGVDGSRLVIGGDSAGGNLSLATAMRLRDHGQGERLRGVLSNYGAFSGVVSDEAEAAHGNGVLASVDMVAYFEHYCGAADGAADPYAAPLYATDFAGLPPVFLAVAEHDVLAEQSHAVAERLAEAGNAVVLEVYRGATHSFLEAMSVSALARRAIADGTHWVAARLAG